MKIIFLIISLLICLTIHASEQRIQYDDLVLGSPKAGSSSPQIKFKGTSQSLKANKTSGKLEFSNDGTTFKKLGSGSGGGSGGINEFEQQDKNPNAEDGTTGWTTVSSTLSLVLKSVNPDQVIEGDQSFRVDFDGQNDEVKSPLVGFNKSYLYGQGCEASVKYYGFDEKVAFQVVNDDGDVLGEYKLIAANTKGEQSVFFRCPTQAEITGDADKGELYLKVIQKDSGDAAAGTFDLTYIGILRNLVETTTQDTFRAKVTGTTVSNESIDWINGNAVLSNTSTYTLTFNNGIFTVAPICFMSYIMNGDNNSRFADIRVDATTSGIVFRGLDSASAAATLNGFNILCFKDGVDAKQSIQVYKSIPKIAEVINDFSAKVSSADVISDQNTTWLTSCTNAGTGLATCVPVAGIFSVVPNCKAEYVGAATYGCDVNSTSTSSAIEVSCRDKANNTLSNQPFNLFCQKAGSDYKNPIVQPVVVYDDQVRFSYWYGGASTSTNCTSSPCTKYSYSSNNTAVTSSMVTQTRGSAGSYTVTVNAGVCRDILACSITGLNWAVASQWSTVGDAVPSSTTFPFYMKNQAGTSQDSVGSVQCSCAKQY